MDFEYYPHLDCPAVVPLSDPLDSFGLPPQEYDPLFQGGRKPFPLRSPSAHAAVPVKPEPNSGTYHDFYDPHRAYWTPHHSHSYRAAAMDMNNSAYPPVSQTPLPLSQPPTPGAECMVSSTISPLQSPFSPRSDEGSLDHFSDTQPIDLGEINIKGLTEEQLVSLTARDLNRICRDLPDDVIKQLKKRRRTLKNRGYAYNSRVRRVSQKNTLEKERDELKHQLAQLNDRCRQLTEEKNQWRRRAQALERGEEVWSPDD